MQSRPVKANYRRACCGNGLGTKLLYGATVMVAVLLTTLPMETVTATVPPVVRPDTIVTVPADTVAKAVLLEVQVATLLTSTDPLQVVASASIDTEGWLLVTVPLVGFKVIDAIHPVTTVTLWVADTEGF
jgi:hypothetical protein